MPRFGSDPVPTQEPIEFVEDPTLAEQAAPGVVKGVKGTLSKGMGVLEQILRGQSATFAGGVSLLDRARQEDEEGDTPLFNIFNPELPGALGEAGRVAVEEFIEYDRKLSFQDVLDAGGVPEFPGRLVFELGGDLIIDPAWVFPFGKVGSAFARGTKGAVRFGGVHAYNGVVKADRFLPGIRDATDAIVPAVREGFEKLATGVKKATKGASTPEGLEFVDESAKLNQRINVEAELLGKERSVLENKIVKQIAEVEGVPVREVELALSGMRQSKAMRHMSFEEVLEADGRLVGHDLPEDVILDLEILQKMGHEAGPFVPTQFVQHLSERGYKSVQKLAQDQIDRMNRVLDVDSAVKAEKKFAKQGKKVDPDSREFKEAVQEIRDDLEFKSDRLDYMHGTLHPTAKTYLTKYSDEFRELGPVWGTDHTALLEKKLKDISVLEVNSLALRGKLDFLPRGMPMFIDDPNLIDAIRTYKTAEAFHTQKFINSTVEKHGYREVGTAAEASPDIRNALGLAGRSEDDLAKIRLAENSAGDIQIVNTLKKEGRFDKITASEKLGIVESTWMPREIAEGLNKQAQIHNSPKLLQGFIDGFDELQSVWKIWTLVPFPAYHARNVVGNMYNSYLAGMRPDQFAKYSMASAQLQALGGGMRFAPKDSMKLLLQGNTRKFIEKQAEKGLSGTASKVLNSKFMGKISGIGAKSLDDDVTIGKVTQTAREWLEEFQSVGVSGGGVFAGEVSSARTGNIVGRAEDVSRAAREARARPGTTMGAFSSVGREIENNARGALYLWARTERGLDATKARTLLNLHLFDYANPDPLTKVSRRVAFPFFSWTRNNIPLQLRYLVQDPAKQATIARIRRSIEANASTDQAVDERYVSEYIRQGMAIRTRRTPEGYEAFVLNNWIPLSDLSEMGIGNLEGGLKGMAEQMGDWAMNALTPIIKLPIESAAKKSFFYDRDFTSEKRRFMFDNISQKQENMLRSIRLFSVIDRLFQSARKDELGKEIIRFWTGLRKQEADLEKNRSINFFDAREEVRELEADRRRVLRREPFDEIDQQEVERLTKEIEEIIEEQQRELKP